MLTIADSLANLCLARKSPLEFWTPLPHLRKAQVLEFRCFSDGAAKGNPGEPAVAAVVWARLQDGVAPPSNNYRYLRPCAPEQFAAPPCAPDQFAALSWPAELLDLA